jgi:hypothetical protein
MFEVIHPLMGQSDGVAVASAFVLPELLDRPRMAAHQLGRSGFISLPPSLDQCRIRGVIRQRIGHTRRYESGHRALR